MMWHIYMFINDHVCIFLLFLASINYNSIDLYTFACLNKYHLNEWLYIHPFFNLQDIDIPQHALITLLIIKGSFFNISNNMNFSIDFSIVKC